MPYHLADCGMGNPFREFYFFHYAMRFPCFSSFACPLRSRTGIETLMRRPCHAGGGWVYANRHAKGSDHR
jgi:hypothetical protein